MDNPKQYFTIAVNSCDKKFAENPSEALDDIKNDFSYMTNAFDIYQKKMANKLKAFQDTINDLNYEIKQYRDIVKQKDVIIDEKTDEIVLLIEALPKNKRPQFSKLYGELNEQAINAAEDAPDF